MGNPNPSPQRFIVTTPGVSATRWLSFVLASHPDVFVAHGKHALDSVVNGNFGNERKSSDVESLTSGNQMAGFYQKLSLDEVFSVYHCIKPTARAYGNVHTYTLQSLINTAGNAKALDGFNILNVLRHPVTYIESHFSLVLGAENHPDLYSHYSDVVFQKALEEYPELFLLECADYRAFLAFAVSCMSVRNFAYDFAHLDFPHFQMEVLTTQVDALQSFCTQLTGQDYSRSELQTFIDQGAINRHRKTNTSRWARDIYDGWATWQRDMAYIMIPSDVLDKLEDIGYDISMLRARDSVSGQRLSDNGTNQEECLADYLRHTSGHESLLEILRRWDAPRVIISQTMVESQPQEEEDLPKLIDSNYHGFNLVHYREKYYGLAQSLGPLDLTGLDEQTAREHQEAGLYFVAQSIDEVKRYIKDPLR